MQITKIPEYILTNKRIRFYLYTILYQKRPFQNKQMRKGEIEITWKKELENVKPISSSFVSFDNEEEEVSNEVVINFPFYYSYTN